MERLSKEMQRHCSVRPRNRGRILCQVVGQSALIDHCLQSDVYLSVGHATVALVTDIYYEQLYSSLFVYVLCSLLYAYVVTWTIRIVI
jgi:hypothetical protein